ncbi:MAG: DUF5134 domain-containing protein [Microbacterium sp.]|uniref:DUF5134 domain-containing protein n=1 Tax=Microbacterium ginsengisoli TaxID=400772 RepID=A0A0F0LTX3_9MICO|nr:DUF5134 domain-containing protein [Microbacterium ginsengisoli]KJL34886.1 hypothetical protein RR49_02777 [Microbacterium ginsengisoli]KJL35029.1 hypothetical protein RR49_02924 [Microbacterium ginsengisoli]MAL07549.1 DUF5134 domain-containing protein [Microbacterium sp.]HAN25639.1 DUF5134 domain-containing protein [Microbacterium ginsengisoli]
MFSPLWSAVFTILFSVTGVVSLVSLVRTRRAAPAGTPFGTTEVVEIAHLLMSIAMVAMVWWAAGAELTWAQIAVFAVVAIALLVSLPQATSRAGRVDLAGHAVVTGAMVWMLVAMPALMGSGGDGASGHHHSGGAADAAAPAATPEWIVVLNGVVIAVVAAFAVWWIVGLVRSSHHRARHVCHALMAGGMAVMLAVMAV